MERLQEKVALISAGLILSELRARDKVSRALVLCPKLLLPQWKEELEEKFRILTEHATGQEVDFLARQSDVPVVATTYESARSRMKSLSESGFDLLILDEAHKLRNLYGTQSAPRIAREIHSALAARSFRYVLFLTATPIQNRLWAS